MPPQIKKLLFILYGLIIVLVLAILLVIGVFNLIDQPQFDTTALSNISAFNSPIQQNLYNDKLLETVSEDYTSFFSPQKLDLIINAKAKYKICAKVLSKHNYEHSWDWSSRISKYDLAFAWGDLATDESKTIQYWQSNRWYYYKYSSNCPYSPSYIVNHSSNHHIIPSDSFIEDILDHVNKGQMICMSGYLVYVDGIHNGNKVWWKSSLTRADTGNGSCEIFYVEDISPKPKKLSSTFIESLSNK